MKWENINNLFTIKIVLFLPVTFLLFLFIPNRDPFYHAHVHAEVKNDHLNKSTKANQLVD